MILELLYALLKGIILAFGVIVGCFLFAGLIIKELNKEDPQKYDLEKLKIAFDKYVSTLYENENYELINNSLVVVNALKEGRIPPEVEKYKIETNLSVDMKNETFKVIENYCVKGLKNNQQS